MKHVRFTYSDACSPLLKDVNFTLHPGQRVAVVGENGSGKSTLIYLLTRLWDVESGSVRINGVDVRSLSPSVVRHNIAVVSPTAHIFHASIANNLRIANPKAALEDLCRIGEEAGLSEWIERLPYGWDTIIGDVGQRPSAGVRQRIAVARALLADPQVFLLDEPLESLDLVAARQLAATLTKVTEGKTTLWITHSLCSLPPMSEIMVLHGGRITERGRHTELMQQQGRYQQMWEVEQNLMPANQ